MPLALYVVSSLLLLGIIVGGVLAYLGISKAVDGFEDEEGFHLKAAGGASATGVGAPVGGGNGDPMSVRI